jgi:hypothetical protein
MHVRVVGRDAAAVHRLVLRHRGRVRARGGRSVRVRLRRLRRSGRMVVTATLRDGRRVTFRRYLTLCTRRR